MDFQAALKIPSSRGVPYSAPLLGGTLKFAGAEEMNCLNEPTPLYLTILLVIIGNLPGAILSFFLFRSLRFGNLEGGAGTQVPLGASACPGRHQHRNVVEVSTRRIKHTEH